MTLIDGEMIIDTVPDSGLKRRYLAYDLMALDAVPKTKVIRSYGAWSYAWYMTLIYKILLFTYFWFLLLSMKLWCPCNNEKRCNKHPFWIISWRPPSISTPSMFCSYLLHNHVCLLTFFFHMISSWAYKVHVATRFIDYNQGCKLFFFYCNLCTWALFTVDWHAEKNSRAIETLIIMAWDYL